MHKLYKLDCSNIEKLCYAAMVAANEYDKNHYQLLSNPSNPPTMLYSLIREIPEFFMQLIVDDGVKQQIKKRCLV